MPFWWRRATFSSSTAAREGGIEGKIARSVVRKTCIRENYEAKIGHIRSDISRFSGATIACRRILKVSLCKLLFEATPDHRALVRMLISEVSVRCTGHLLAISSSRERCSMVKGPSNRTSRSILSSMPSFVSHSEQSAAYIFECRSQTVTRSNGQFLCRAYIPTVIDVQEPRAASKKS